MPTPDFIDRLPKAELHVHAEAMGTPALTRAKAAEHGIALPGDFFTPDGAGYRWNGFVDVVTHVYDTVASTLRTGQDFSDIAFDYLKRCAAENVIYVEIIASPDHGDRLGLSYRAMIDGLANGIDRARAASGIEARINATLVRHLPMNDVWRAAANIINYRHPYVTGLDLAGAEKEGDIATFKDCFDEIARRTKGELGMRLHAAEAAGPKNGWDALHLLNPTRLGHGIRAIEDPALIQEFVKRGTVLEICPTSNVLAGFYNSFADHPLRRLKDAGVRVCLNSDDPGLFGNSVGGEYRLAHEKFGFTEKELLTCTRTAIESAFVDEPTRKKLLEKLDAHSFFLQQPRNRPPSPGGPAPA